jgi:flagella basal body P-ring formation protein FlgA
MLCSKQQALTQSNRNALKVEIAMKIRIAIRIATVFHAMVFLLFGAASASAMETESPQRISAEVRSFLSREAMGLPGRSEIQVGPVDARLKLARCGFLQTFFPTGSRAWGKTSVGVRCAGDRPWTIYVPARVKVIAPFLVTVRGLEPGQTVRQADLVYREGDLTTMPSGTLTDPIEVEGRLAARRIGPGQPLQRSMLRAQKVVKNGQIVGLVAQGPGFRITTEGRAIGDAAEGNLVHVRTANGKVVSGIVRAGPVVEIMR